MNKSSLLLKQRAGVWLILAVLLLVLWGLIFVLYGKKQQLAKGVHQQSMMHEIALPSHIENGLNEFKNEVMPLDLTVSTQLRDYPAEFKDKAYFQKHRKKWTVQVMDVAEHQIIEDYLRTRSDRSQFAYFRYTDVNHKERYLLTYGLMSAQAATGVASQKQGINFNLPSSNRVIPEQIGRYLSMIDSYHVNESEANQVQEVAATRVQLTETEQVVAPKPAFEALDKADKTDKTNQAKTNAEQQTPELSAPPTARPTIAPTERPSLQSGRKTGTDEAGAEKTQE